MAISIPNQYPPNETEFKTLCESLGYTLPTEDVLQPYVKQHREASISKIDALTSFRSKVKFASLNPLEKEALMKALFYTFRYYLQINQQFLSNISISAQQGSVSASTTYPQFPDRLPSIVYDNLIQSGLYSEAKTINLFSDSASQRNRGGGVYDNLYTDAFDWQYLTKYSADRSYVKPLNITTDTLKIEYETDDVPSVKINLKAIAQLIKFDDVSIKKGGGADDPYFVAKIQDDTDTSKFLTVSEIITKTRADVFNDFQFETASIKKDVGVGKKYYSVALQDDADTTKFLKPSDIINKAKASSGVAIDDVTLKKDAATDKIEAVGLKDLSKSATADGVVSARNVLKAFATVSESALTFTNNTNFWPNASANFKTQKNIDDDYFDTSDAAKIKTAVPLKYKKNVSDGWQDARSFSLATGQGGRTETSWGGMRATMFNIETLITHLKSKIKPNGYGWYMAKTYWAINYRYSSRTFRFSFVLTPRQTNFLLTKGLGTSGRIMMSAWGAPNFMFDSLGNRISKNPFTTIIPAFLLSEGGATDKNVLLYLISNHTTSEAARMTNLSPQLVVSW